MIQAHFKDIRNKIIEQIGSSKEEILICVAWFTSKEILGKLIDKAESGCKIKIIISDHFENKRLSFKEIQNKNGLINILSANSGRFLHDKFAVFDKKKVLFGSYNWTNSAEFFNHENIIISDDETLLKQFLGRFKHLETIAVNYEIQKLSNITSIDSESKEEEFEKIENELLNELLRSLDESLKAGAKINKTTITDMLFRYGAIGTARKLMKDGAENIQSGLLKMYEIERLDLTFENIILKPRYRVLFNDETINKAIEKLEKLGYKNYV
ncbi:MULTISPECIES: phospholipase D-like domain-containing protein [Flavobacterium]|uniref:phospholipase D-like domain-containing protein n=1 Tax=Flavobacterium TaxID=237 RepID=UPI0023E45553|nr:phospholipase D-like domain-containing protein [Flavobacterium sp. YJ01]WET02541.1 phospholipase D-like domain-containing protein [Flavobacterium sp. YJ01]